MVRPRVIWAIAIIQFMNAAFGIASAVFLFQKALRLGRPVPVVAILLCAYCVPLIVAATFFLRGRRWGWWLILLWNLAPVPYIFWGALFASEPVFAEDVVAGGWFLLSVILLWIPPSLRWMRTGVLEKIRRKEPFEHICYREGEP